MNTDIAIPRLRFFPILIFAFLVSAIAVQAQQPQAQDIPQGQEYSDEELQTFVEAALEVMPLQEESQLKMIGEIEQRDLTVDKFNVILETKQMGQDPDATEEELEVFEDALKAIQAIQIQYHEDIVRVIEDSGISIEKYEEIMINYQQDPSLQVRIGEIMENMD
jgi:hypothetical protein